MAQFHREGTPASEGSASEWEYEYHPTETDTYYVTLDLSSATQDVQTRRGEKLALAASAIAASKEGPPADASLAENDGAVSASDANNPKAHVQVLAIGSKNPLVSFDGDLYSCEWASTIGTDLILAPSDTQLPFDPVHQGDGFQVAALCDMRLMGTKARFVPREKAVPVDAAHHMQIPIATTVNEHRRKQAGFLGRVMSLKAGRGDTDEVTLLRGKTYKDFGVDLNASRGDETDHRNSQGQREGVAAEPQEWDADEALSSNIDPRLQHLAVSED